MKTNNLQVRTTFLSFLVSFFGQKLVVFTLNRDKIASWFFMVLLFFMVLHHLENIKLLAGNDHVIKISSLVKV